MPSLRSLIRPTGVAFACMAALANAAGAEPARLANGLVEIRISPEHGSYELIDVKVDAPVLGRARTGFSIAPYLELDDLGPDDFETDAPAVNFTSTDGLGSVTRAVPLPTSFAGGDSLSLASRVDGVGELRVQFTLYPGKPFVEIGFAFTNLGTRPVRLRRVEVVRAGDFLPGGNPELLRLLGGGSGISRTTVVRGPALQAENNALCFFADPARPRALVAGGLTYSDFRTFIDVAGGGLAMHADDPVGKRVDPGQTYRSADCFYLDGLATNPFTALESYAETTRAARGIRPHYYQFPSTCMWFLAVDHFGGDTGSTNNSVGAVNEMRHIVQSGFLKYAPVAVRLVPDCYEQNNQQGWWDDEHWRKHGRKERCVVDRHYQEPYETTRKWAAAIRELGGIPIHYFQPGIRSEDYAEAFPGHMLYNQAHKYIKKDGKNRRRSALGDRRPRHPEPRQAGRMESRLWETVAGNL
jgi:hypothetical protein